MLSFLVNLIILIRPEENDLLSDFCGLYYKDIKIENDTSNVDSKWHLQIVASLMILIDDTS